MPGNRSLTEQLVWFCAPTLANIKTGSLFSCGRCSQCDVYAEIRELNRILNGKGLRLIPIVTGKQCVLIYLYRRQSLLRDLSGEKTRSLLQKCGYTGSNPELCIKRLIQKLKKKEGFPHEIGLFLGYPPEDVEGFMNNGAKNYLLCGTWKVYHDPEGAQETFRKYRKCEKRYRDCFENGFGIERLAVAG